MFLFFMLYHLMLSGNFYGSEIWPAVGMGFFWVLLEGQGIFLGLIFAPIRSSLSLEIQSTPLGIKF